VGMTRRLLTSALVVHLGCSSPEGNWRLDGGMDASGDGSAVAVTGRDAGVVDVGVDVENVVGDAGGEDADAETVTDVADAGGDAGRDVGADVGCGTGQALCGGRCVNIGIDVAHCGACGRACPAPVGGTVTCVGGVCGSSCPSGMSVCGGACVSLGTNLHCGACGNACAAGQSCAAGSCAVRCGDWVTGAGESCDDGNIVSGDGCSSGCRTEPPCPAGMRLVPAGMFLMGSTAQSDEQPIHGVQLSAFCMDETEVTVPAWQW
jgi:cysteine-rich repeat protein